MKIVTTHRGADFDALACLVAATVLYPGARPVLPNSVNPNLKAFLSIHKELFQFISPNDISPDLVDTLIVVDTGSWNRLEGMDSLKDSSGLKIIVWDHHEQGTIDAGQAVIENTGACITLLVEEIQRRRKLVTPIQATLFLIGLYEDTGNLTFASTTPRDAYAAGYLLDRRADLNILGTFLRQAYGKQQKDILFRMIQEAGREDFGDYSMSIVTMEVQGRIENLAMVMQMYREIVNVDVAFGIFRDVERDRCMIIARSNVDAINVGMMMRAMGGGGHPGAGSALIKSAAPEAVEDMIRELVKGNQYSSVMLRDIMSYPVLTVEQDTPVEEVARLLREVGCTGMPVVDENERIVGIVSRRDFKKVKKTAQMKSPIKAFMSRDVVTISHEKSALEAARLMIKNDIGRIPVMQDGKIIGIITRSDAMMYFYDLLPD